MFCSQNVKPMTSAISVSKTQDSDKVKNFLEVGQTMCIKLCTNSKQQVLLEF